MGCAERSAEGRTYFVYVFVHLNAYFIYSRHLSEWFLIMRYAGSYKLSQLLKVNQSHYRPEVAQRVPGS